MYANVSTDYRAEHEVQVLTNLEFNNNNFNPHREVSANHSCGGAVTGLLRGRFFRGAYKASKLVS